MSILGKKESGVFSELNDHLTAYMNWIKLGRSKFRGKKEIGDLFIEMDNTRFLFEQAMGGSMYDYQKKLERNVWAGAVYKYDEEMQKLKEALVRAVDHCEAGEITEEEAKTDLLKADSAPSPELSLKEEMEMAEKKEAEEAQKEEEAYQKEKAEKQASKNTDAMTEADCRELWRIYQGMNTEYKEMKRLADRWMADHPEKGCLGVTLMLLVFPVGAIYGLFQVF